MLLCSVAYATDIAIVEPPPISDIPLGISSLEDFPIEPPQSLPTDTNALLEAILGRLDFMLFVLLPLVLAVLVVFLFCWWFSYTFLNDSYFQ